MKVSSLWFLSALFLLVSVVASAQEQSERPNLLLTGEFYPKADSSAGFSTMERLGFLEDSKNLDLHMVLEANNDKQFGSDTVFLRNTNNIGNYFLVDQGYLRLKGLGLQFQAGRFLPVDEVDSPYSLVLNSQVNSPNPESMAQYGMTLKYSLGPFTYSSEWIQLNYRSDFGSLAAAPPAWAAVGSTGFPDRGTDIHNFVFHSGDWRFGFQDQSIYSQRNYDPEYFFSPVPQYFTQYLRNIQGRPWTTGGTDKYMMGLFGEWNQTDRDAYVQLQMADFNLHFLNANIFPNNPGKFAWSFGGHIINDWGRWGLFHAGATKFMYEPLTMGTGDQAVRDFGNFYYPDTVYSMNGGFVPINLQANQIGYTNGENNLAFMATWEQPYLEDRLKLKASLEFLLAGNNSPANPWQDTNGQNEMGTQILSDPNLEKSIKTNIHGAYLEGPWTFSVDLTMGEIFNVLQLQDPSNTDPSWSAVDRLVQIWKASDKNQAIFTLILGVKYVFDATPMLDEMARQNTQALSD